MISEQVGNQNEPLKFWKWFNSPLVGRKTRKQEIRELESGGWEPLGQPKLFSQPSSAAVPRVLLANRDVEIVEVAEAVLARDTTVRRG